MPLPLAPIAGVALRYGAVALTTYAISRKISAGRRDQRAEDALDTLEDGPALRHDTGQTNATYRYKRTITMGTTGPRFEIDFASITRLRIRKL